MQGWWRVAGLCCCLAGCTPPTAPRGGPSTEASASVEQTAPPLGTGAEVQPASSASPPAAAESTPALEAPSADGHNRLSPAEIAAGWIRLFDGHTLFGWRPNSATNWQVADGVLSASGETKGLLVTTTRFADYELRCDFRLEAGGNSGLFLRTAFLPQDPAVDCYELNICDSHPEFKTASLVKRAKPSGEITTDGAWHSYFVTVHGPRVVVQLDGREVLQYVDDGPQPLTSGFIGLQMNGGRVEFRNVFLRPLGMRELFDGETLTGWRIVPGSHSQFTVEDGAIRVKGGRGFLETECTAGDFVLQFAAKTNGERLNSGVFFRAQPGTAEAPSNGYEFQIHHGFKDGDRQQPQDFGTGAIFRRVAARRVVAQDREWFTATLVADGPHFATWVDGIQVVDWTDTRPPDANPRQGLRLEPGHLSLQGHDPGTDLLFRGLRLADLPPAPF
uniref:DUF1080 domain-containing protein n=1 Tax=Schlesneria paludicola TaxID=360056 RepID=A0A7C4QRJ7_9PLAN